jgi:hypothetical protein
MLLDNNVIVDDAYVSRMSRIGMSLAQKIKTASESMPSRAAEVSTRCGSFHGMAALAPGHAPFECGPRRFNTKRRRLGDAY